MSQLEVRTNHVPRDLLMLDDLPIKIQEEFGYIEGDDRYMSRFVKFKGEYYDVFDTQMIRVEKEGVRCGWEMGVEPDHPFAKWDSVMSDSYSSGLLFRITLDDRCVVGQFF